MSQSFRFHALDDDHNPVEGSIEADNRRQAIAAVERRGLLPIRVVARAPAKTRPSRAGRRRVRPAELAGVLEQFHTLLAAGVAMDEAVNSIAGSRVNPALSAVFADIGARLRQGAPLAEAMTAAKLPAPPYVFQLVRAGELSGDLAAALAQAAEQMSYEIEVAGEVRQALIYPAILIGSGILAVVIIFTAVVPRFSRMLDQADQLPFLAWAVLAGGQAFNQWLPWIAGSAAALVLIVVVILRQPSWRRRLLLAAGRLPGLSGWWRQVEMARWSGICGRLLQSRVGVVQAIDLANGGVVHPGLQRRLALAVQQLRGGKTLHEALVESDALDPMALDLVRVGERSGELPRLLLAVSANYTRSGRVRTRRFLSILEPVAILVIGAVLGTMMAGIIMAITATNDIAI